MKAPHSRCVRLRGGNTASLQSRLWDGRIMRVPYRSFTSEKFQYVVPGFCSSPS